jgi:peptidoglycan hydrolase CwlO-like protein
MNKIQLSVVCLLLVANINTLKLDGHNHLAYDNAQDYLQGLQSQQAQFEAAIQKLDADVDKTLNDTSAKTDIVDKIKVLEQGILNQEDEIFIASTKIIPVLVLKDQCTNLTESDKTALIQKC